MIVLVYVPVRISYFTGFRVRVWDTRLANAVRQQLSYLSIYVHNVNLTSVAEKRKPSRRGGGNLDGGFPDGGFPVVLRSAGPAAGGASVIIAGRYRMAEVKLQEGKSPGW